MPKRKGFLGNRGYRWDGERAFFCLLMLIVLVWFSGYLLFLSSAPATNTNTIKPKLQTPTDSGEKEENKPTPVSSGGVKSEDELDSLYDEEEAHKAEAIMRRKAVRRGFQHAWKGYVKYAWGYDEIKPVSLKGDQGWGGLGATIVDSIDTLLIMGFDEEYKLARSWVENLDFNVNYDASTFETTIRYVGGLLAAFELTDDNLFLEKAQDLGDRIMKAFRTPSGIPYSTVNLRTGVATSPSWSGGSSFLAEFGTVQMEYRYLSKKTGNQYYAETVDKVTNLMDEADTSSFSGLYPSMYHPNRRAWTSTHLTFGARGDSFYEYLLKQYIQSGKKDEQVWGMYKRAMDGMKKLLLKKTSDGLTFIDEMEHGSYKSKFDHLVCFMGGTLALDGIPGHLKLAEEIAYTCWQMYERNPSGLAPEIATLTEGRPGVHNKASHYLLRPETVEAFFVLYRVTGDKKYQDWGWEVFQALEKHCKTEGGYSGVTDVGKVPVNLNNKVESFFFAETMKYLYLLFSPRSYISLDEFVFNTEAHPTRIFRD
eukprot:TRINITY_DN561_c0_g1_i1.p1 TRINITY_DN561_c0_g1~~TRINITY_DN561_c0_g1_i1.p1  ORF type:complete len:574 (-),score=141.75 TRINITY_DN561_c0_g1_i1:21-1631(-)